MASAWIARRRRKNGGHTFRVMFRTGGREAPPRYGGSFRTMREAKIRRDVIAGELAALRVPELRLVAERADRTLRTAAERWRASRGEVAENTKTRHGLEVNRILPLLGSRLLDEITSSDVAEFVAALVTEGYARGTIRKTLQTLAMILDDAGVSPTRPAIGTCAFRARSRKRSTRPRRRTWRLSITFSLPSTGCRSYSSTGRVPVSRLST
jgi:hypothetical protein